MHILQVFTGKVFNRVGVNHTWQSNRLHSHQRFSCPFLCHSGPTVLWEQRDLWETWGKVEIGRTFMIKPYIPVAEHFIFSAVVLLGGHMHLPPSPKALHETGLWTSTFRSVKMCWWLPLLEGLILRGVSEVHTLKTSRHLSPYSQSEDRFCNQLFLSLPITATAEIGAEGFRVSLCCYEIIGINWIRTFGHVPI